MQPPSVLFLDVEGGWGGSSRSLYYLIEASQSFSWQPYIVTRKPGPVDAKYVALGVAHDCIPELPSFRPSERKNWYSFAQYGFGLRRWRVLRNRIGKIVRTHNVALIHVNHESLALIGARLARALELPWTCHIRTQLIPGYFARHVYRLINEHARHVIMIAEPNRDHFEALVGARFNREKTSVVHNIIPAVSEGLSPLPALRQPADALRVLSLSNFSPNRGVDRIVDVAAVLQRLGRDDIVFFLCGRAAHRSHLPWRRNDYLDRILARVDRENLGHLVRFPGYVDRPIDALAACHVLVKLTRQNNPWGRDIIEAMAVGRPVVTIGSYQKFVSDGVNGFVDTAFDAEKVAHALVRLREDPDLRGRMGAAAKARAAELFGPEKRAAEMARIFKQVCPVLA